ncbi:MAG: ribonuclease P protein component 4 [Candidatus Woesearchaeota archaeon]
MTGVVRKKSKRRLPVAKKRQHEIAKEHISSLFKEQRKRLYSDKRLAQRYTNHIRRIGMKFRLKLPREVKRSYCKHCKTVFIPGKNCRVRLRRKKLIYHCFECKKHTRLPYWKRS